MHRSNSCRRILRWLIHPDLVDLLRLEKGSHSCGFRLVLNQPVNHALNAKVANWLASEVSDYDPKGFFYRGFRQVSRAQPIPMALFGDEADY